MKRHSTRKMRSLSQVLVQFKPIENSSELLNRLNKDGASPGNSTLQGPWREKRTVLKWLPNSYQPWDKELSTLSKFWRVTRKWTRHKVRDRLKHSLYKTWFIIYLHPACIPIQVQHIGSLSRSHYSGCHAKLLPKKCCVSTLLTTAKETAITSKKQSIPH